MDIGKGWRKFGQNQLNLKQEAKDYRPSEVDFKETLVFWLRDTRNVWKGKSWRYAQEDPTLHELKTQNTENQNITKPSTTTSMLT